VKRALIKRPQANEYLGNESSVGVSIEIEKYFFIAKQKPQIYFKVQITKFEPYARIREPRK